MTSIKFRALTHDDHKFFFEALGEYGKDFQNIQQYMAQKSAKSGTNKTSEQNKSIDAQERRDQDKKEDDKKREQIRNFYNKLYTKLSQLVNLTGKIDDRVEKVNQELYLLINYGEIWKKHGFKFNNKTKKLLEELVFQGYTTLRFKNKNVRLRTPPCKALKKINGIGIDEKEKVVTSRELPKEVIVEFHPAKNRDWLKVQSMSQNPLVRARLSIQKRLSNILEFLENKWNVSQEKLNRTVDVWLKVPLNAQVQTDSNTLRTESTADNGTCQKEALLRLRLRPSAQHELKEVNITRVVPDNHLDLSLHAYIKRTKPKAKNTDVEMVPVENCVELSQGALSTGSQRGLPLSLTTPDCSLLFERSCTSDLPSIANQARKHLNILQSLAGTFEGCENSRTACEETRTSYIDSERTNLFPTKPMEVTTIPALFDEDAAMNTNLSVDFHIPKDKTLGDWFKEMNGQGDGDDANDAFPTSEEKEPEIEAIEAPPVSDDNNNDSTTGNNSDTTIGANSSKQPESSAPNTTKSHNHMIDIQRLAEGWTRKDEPSITIGELYLAFKCPEKIVLEYEFEQIPNDNRDSSPQSTTDVQATNCNDVNPAHNSVIFKLLTAASLSLAHIERQKQEQQHRLHDQSNAKLKRRKGQGQVRSLQDIEMNNQRVEEALKQLRTTKLTFKRAR